MLDYKFKRFIFNIVLNTGNIPKYCFNEIATVK